MDYVGPLGKNRHFFVSLGIAQILRFLSFLFILKLSGSNPFHNTLNYASTANIEEVMKFYNLGHKTFETDFSYGPNKNTITIHLKERKSQMQFDPRVIYQNNLIRNMFTSFLFLQNSFELTLFQVLISWANHCY